MGCYARIAEASEVLAVSLIAEVWLAVIALDVVDNLR